MKNKSKSRRGVSILLRTALLSWMVTIATLLIFVMVNIPYQRKTFLENLNSKAQGISVSLQDVTAGSIVTEDYSAVVDHARQILAGDPSIEFIVITKNDGFSLINEQIGWKTADLGAYWHPARREARGGIEFVPLFQRRVLFYSSPFNYSSIEWGWIHVGLSLQAYDLHVASVYYRTGGLAVLCVFIALAASIIYARKLVRPLLDLRQAVQRVTGGDLHARASIHSGDEVEGLAHSFNTMTDTLLQRDGILQSVRFAAQQFLAAPNWESVIECVLAQIGQAANASHVHVFVNHKLEDGSSMTVQHYEWVSPLLHAEIDKAYWQKWPWKEKGFRRWVDDLEQGLIIPLLVSLLPDRERGFLEQQGIKALVFVPVRTTGGLWGFLGLDDCVQEREWSAAELDSFRAAADTLGSAVERQKTENALIQAKEAAEAASQSKSQFLANMSHEIRTPITVVIGMLKLLQKTELDSKQGRYTANAVTAAETLLTVLSDILDFSKIEAGRLELEESPVTVDQLVEGAIRMFAEKAEQKGIELAYQVDEEIPIKLYGDPNRLRQILVNLVGNAIKFTDTGEIVILCQKRCSTETETTLRFQVRDTGCGIAPQDQSVIFDAFAQADGSMKRVHGGTGLGLAISRNLCGLMGGEIGVESEPGHGSRFWFTVRLKNAESAETEKTRYPEEFSNQRVLIVDDCETVRDIMREYIWSWRGVPDVAADAGQALEKLRKAAKEKKAFTVAILDWKMPGVDGLVLAHLIKAEDTIQDTKLILMSSFTLMNETDVQKAGFEAYVPKPIQRSDLYNAIVTVTQNHTPPESSWHPEDPRDEAFPAGNKMILLAEDNAIIQEVVQGILGELGYQCKGVSNGAEAVEMVKTGVYPLVLMDCQMPKMDGYDASRTIRKWESEQAEADGKRRHVPIVAMTAHVMKGDRERCLAAGMDDYLTKPVDPEQLEILLGKWSAKLEAPLAGEIPPPAVENTPPEPRTIFHYESLLRRCMGKRDLAASLAQKFVRQAREDTWELERNLGEGNPEVLAQTAHRLKGAAGMVSAEAIQARAAELEEMARENDLRRAEAVISGLPGELELLTAQIETHFTPDLGAAKV